MLSSCVFSVLAGLTAGITVMRVALPKDKLYISFEKGHLRENSVIQCQYALGPGEEVASIRWDILKDWRPEGSFTWMPSSPGTATGILQGKVNEKRNDGDLELTSLAYELSANYSCTVSTEDGQSKSATGEILVVDDIGSGYSMSVRNMGCAVDVSVSNRFIFPRPTVRGGLYSHSLGRYFEPAQYTEVRSGNGSVQFTLDQKFEISEDTPRDAIFKNEVGVTKSDGTWIELSSNHISLNHFNFDSLCNDIVVDETKEVSYNFQDKSCYGLPKSPNGRDLKASVFCAKGYRAVGGIESARMTCILMDVMKYKWVPDMRNITPRDVICEPGSSKRNETSAASKTHTNALFLTMLLASAVHF